MDDLLKQASNKFFLAISRVQNDRYVIPLTMQYTDLLHRSIILHIKSYQSWHAIFSDYCNIAISLQKVKTMSASF